MIPTEDIMPIVKNTIAASIKCNTHRGYIGWSSCDNICMDMHDCLDMCAETLEMRGYMVALEAATYILVSGVKLASHADSSSGMLTDVIMCTYELNFQTGYPKPFQVSLHSFHRIGKSHISASHNASQSNHQIHSFLPLL